MCSILVIGSVAEWLEPFLQGVVGRKPSFVFLFFVFLFDENILQAKYFAKKKTGEVL